MKDVQTQTLVTIASVSALLMHSPGCGGGARQASVEAWQKNVEQYVRVQGKGDPAVVKDVLTAKLAGMKP